MQDEILTTETLAKYLHMNSQVIARMAREGRIPAYKLGKKWLFKRSIIDQWLEKKIKEKMNET
jgi:excisionase family DNA binding protein